MLFETEVIPGTIAFTRTPLGQDWEVFNNFGIAFVKNIQLRNRILD